MSATLNNFATNSNVGLSTSRAASLSKSWVSLADVFCFAAPALQFVQIQFMGTLLATDLLILAALPIAIIRHADRLKQKPIPTFLTLGGFWMISQVATDIFRQSAPEDYLRGWIKIALVLASFVVVWAVVCVNMRRFILYGLGVAVGAILTLYLHPTDDMIATPWKFGLATPITILVGMYAARSTKHKYLGLLLPMLVLAVVHSYLDTRSLALMSLLTACYTLFQMSMAGKQNQIAGGRLVLLAAVVGVCIFGFTAVYSHYAEQGVFGKYAQQKLEAQSGEGGLLLGGRSEILASGQAILDSPILGHGSWAHDPTYAAILDESRAELGYKSFQNSRKDDLIPTHSHIFGAWVDGGLAGAIFWIYALVYAIRSLMKVSGFEPMLHLFSIVGFMLVWDILFSPISPERRFVTPYYLAAMILLRLSHDRWQPVSSEEI
jgi:hypothetical protein